MLSFDDLLAARILSRDGTIDANTLLIALDSIDAGGSRSLLVDFVNSGLLTWDQTMAVQERINTYKRQHGLRIYGSILTQSSGLASDRIAAIAKRRVRDPEELGRALVEGGALTPERESELRFKARVAFDRDLARQVEAYRETRVGGDLTEEEESISQVVSLPREATLGPDDSEEPTLVLTDAELSTISGSELPAMPEFEIPDWVDTSGPLVGESRAGYRILGKIGSGASGVVYLADHPEDPARPVALKLLREMASPEAVGRFRRAIKASTLLVHPGLINVYDGGEGEDGTLFLALEFFDGQTLAQVLDAETSFSPTRALTLARQVFAALQSVHAVGVVHRDVKPANILLSVDGKSARLMDFGIAKLESAPEDASLFVTRTGQGLIGTPMYASPEQAYVRSKITPAADLYSMGLVLYEMLSGRLPFPPQENAWAYVSCHMHEAPIPLAEAAPKTAELPAALHDLLARLLEKKPDDRPRSAAYVVKVLDEVLEQVGSALTTGRWLFGLIGKRRES